MNKEKLIRKGEKGITLIALIITIVVLLILAVVAIRAVENDGIIEYAKNARDEYTAKADEEQEDLNNLLGQIEASLSEEEKITWTKTSTGDLAIGSTVKHIATEEEFYVIGFAGTNNETVKLLAKNNLKADGSAQDSTGAINPCKFTEVAVAGGFFTAGEDLNKNSTIIEDTTSQVYRAMKYGETLGVTTGRLMLYSEAEDLNNDEYSDILCGTNGKSSGEYLIYSLGTARTSMGVWIVYGNEGSLGNSANSDFGCLWRGAPSCRNLKV